jgi:DNA-binding transcriptional MerR regulator
VRLRAIERLRRDLGANLAGIAVILDLVDRLTTLQREVERWRTH